MKSVINHSSITLPNYVDFAVLQNSVRGVYIFYIYDADYSFIYAFNMASVEYIRYYDSANTLYIECLHDTRFFKTGTRHIRKLTHVFYTCFIKKMKIRGRK